MHVEEALFRAFVVPAKIQRYADLLATKRGRTKVVSGLDHFSDLDPRFCRKITDSGDRGAILHRLHELGAPSLCHVISSNAELDGRDMPLRDALALAVGSGFGTFISCVPGQLGYFEGEGPSDRYICHREW
jgi:hypothetical protein